MKNKAHAGLVAAAVLLTVGLAACAPSGSNSTEWSIDSDCTECHTAEAASSQDSSCLAATHETNDCTDCHTETTALEEAHEEVTSEDTMPTKLTKSNEIASEVCLVCHESWEALAEETAETTTLTDSEGTTVNPHDLPDGHVDDKVTCTDCHEVHTGSDLEETATDFCTNCHHQNVYECNTCHE